MSLHAMYYDDGNLLTLEAIREAVEDELLRDATLADLRAYVERRGLEPVTRCQLCERKLKDGGPLCATCRSACQAHARLDAATREWEADGRPD